ncbi:hypothetical protein JHK84_047801 [Glycine max]|nr:hypothetical protein JHK86_047781 [Glycine max]KAG4943752.1 hypothetical protein JHK85_048398 [Glycine max]KAG5102832.1 hypothetical protein JHK84_047801 [Glycine max]
MRGSKYPISSPDRNLKPLTSTPLTRLSSAPRASRSRSAPVPDPRICPNPEPCYLSRDEESGKILNLVFVWAEDGMKLKVDVPVVFKGEDACPGVQKGGILNKIRPSLRFLCPSEHIPSNIAVDVSNLDIEDRIFMRDIEVHPSLKLLSKNENMPVCKIVPTSLGNKEPIEA